MAAILTFVPNIGPLLASIPAVLFALMRGPMVALWAIIVILVVQTVESYLLTPLVQQRTVSLPPALVIAVQILMGLTAGLMGLFLATPIAAMALVLINRIYIEGVLGDAPAASQA